MNEEFEWDPRKAESNLAIHKVSFDRATEIFNGPRLVVPDTRKNYGEDRYVSLGAVEGRCLVVVHTPRGEKTRIISARKANRREQDRYNREIVGKA
jgi:uncharacterized protein